MFKKYEYWRIRMIYFDFAATTPLDSDAAEVFVQASTEYLWELQALSMISAGSHKTY